MRFRGDRQVGFERARMRTCVRFFLPLPPPRTPVSARIIRDSFDPDNRLAGRVARGRAVMRRPSVSAAAPQPPADVRGDAFDKERPPPRSACVDRADAIIMM